MKFKTILLLSLAVLSVESQALRWKGIFVAGDNSIENFDNAREDLSQAFAKIAPINAYHLSSMQQYISDTTGVAAATAKNLQQAFAQLKTTDGDACLIHMTSHGAKGRGFYLALAGILPPELFSSWVKDACGDAPTVVLISACYSGQFITDSLKGPNRIILTAARPDRPSFGCSADIEYTYWDGCMLQEIARSATWADLYKNVNTCISAKENLLHAQPSEPQAFFGDNAKDWKILH